MKKLLLFIALFCAMTSCASECDVDQYFASLAAKEYLVPVHPGGNGRAFWNGFASKFIYAPSFDFLEVEGAENYLFTATADDGDCWNFTATSPQSALSPIWGAIPEGTNITLTVDAVAKDGSVLGRVGEKKFWRDYGFNPPYTGAVRGYREAAILGMMYVHTMPAVQNFVKSTEPDMSYVYFTYPCKIIGSLVRIELLLAGMVPHYEDEAFAIAKNAAQFLIDHARKPSEPLAYFPPTYYKQYMASKEPENQGKTMAMEAVSAGQAYLDMYNATSEEVYLEHALGIANTYLRLQCEDGSWHIKYDYATGEPVNNVKAMLHPLLSYFLRLEQEFGQTAYIEARKRGERWMEEHILSTFDMTGQFEDVSVEGLQPYENLTNCTAAPYASYLLLRGATPEELLTANDLIRFSEDQFVYWDCPTDANGFKRDATPCVFEQYKYQMPIDNSACNVANAMLDIYDYTNDELMFAKAKALIDNITVVQDVNTGKIPTSWRVRFNVNPSYWINCTYDSVSVLLRLAE